MKIFKKLIKSIEKLIQSPLFFLPCFPSEHFKFWIKNFFVSVVEPEVAEKRPFSRLKIANKYFTKVCVRKPNDIQLYSLKILSWEKKCSISKTSI